MNRDHIAATVPVRPSAGTWYTERRIQGTAIVAPSRHQGGSPTTVAMLFGHSPEVDANARLVVDAKAGLAHVKALIEEVDADGRHNLCAMEGDPDCVVTRARAWVAKVEGQTP